MTRIAGVNRPRLGHALMVLAILAAPRMIANVDPYIRLMAASGQVAPAAAETLDQQFDATAGPGSTSGTGAGFTNASDIAQTLTVGISGLLTRVDVQVYVDALFKPTHDLIVEIRPTVNGVPDDNDASVLATATAKPGAVPVGFAGGANFTSFDLRTAQLRVTRGDVLAIVLKTADTAAGYFWITKESATYSAGGFFFRNRLFPRFQSGNRTGGLLVDSGFRTFVEPDSPTAKLLPSADAYVRAGMFASQNFGSASTLVSKKGVSPDNTRRSYLKFDISSINDVERATLRLYGHLSSTATREAVTTIYAVRDTSWGERTVTWNTRPDLDHVVGRVTVAGTTRQWLEIDVTRFVRAELQAGRSVISLSLRNVEHSSAFAEFGSRESGTLAPQLVITQ